MSHFPSCCPVGSGPGDVVHTIINIGGFSEVYVVGTGPNPFELRTFQSSDASVSITENVDNIDLSVTPGSIINVGGFTEVFVVGTSNPFELRTFQSSDGSVTIIENADDIDLSVEITQCFQVDSVATLMTNANTFTTLATLAGNADVLDGEEWKINMCVLVCVPFGLGSTATNSEVRWSIETAAAVFTEFDRYSSRDQIAISGNQQSQPMHRTKNLLAAMDAPRMLVECRRTTSGSTNFLWEIPRWGGTQIEVAP